MKILIDDANVAKLKEILAYYPVDGVTTNPSILAASGRPPFEVLSEIRSLIGERELHVQVIASTAEGMVADAEAITSRLGRETFVKIPSVPEGFRAMQMLKSKGFNVTATAIYTPMQAFLAAASGADYAAPYVNRIDNLGANGIETAKTIHDIFKKNNLPTELLAASFKNSQQVLELVKHGVGAATIGADVFLGLVKNPTVTAAVAAFTQDFEKLCGKGQTMATI